MTCVTEQTCNRSLAHLSEQEGSIMRHALIADSRNYWERRYRSGRHSGAGSYNELATYKAQVINAYVVEHRISVVVELGCGDGNQLSLAAYPFYIGLDVASTIVNSTRLRFRNDPSKAFVLYDFRRGPPDDLVGDLAVSLDVLYHLVEFEVFVKYIDDLFAVATRHVIIYSSDVNHWQASHVLSRRFAQYISLRYPCWYLAKHLDKPDQLRPKDGRFFAEFFMYRRHGL